jgi:signal transduction histidine kinase
MLTRRSWFVYGLFLAIWLALIGWQAAEHLRFKKLAQTELVNHAKIESSTVAGFVRSVAFFGVADTNRLENALKELVTPGEQRPTSIALLNARDEILVSAGTPIDFQRIVDAETNGGAQWDGLTQTVLLMNLVDLGSGSGLTNTTIISSPEDFRRPRFTNSPSGTNFGTFPSPTATAATTNSNSFAAAEQPRLMPLTNTPEGTNNTGDQPPRRRRRGSPDRPFERPFWMSEDDYNALIQKRGVHAFVVVMSTRSMLTTIQKDLWLRAFIASLASLAVAGYALAWGNLKKTSDLQIRLVRASELNSHLKQMNLAAAGLAHETRNPLNIVRGLAQMISRNENAPTEIRTRSREIIDETDRVTGQLNEFINYSRPREVRRTAVSVNSLAGEVVRALNYDLDEKKVQVRVTADPLTIQADEQLLRQALFNLVINAVQAVPAGGEIWIRAGRREGGEAFIEVADNGPGVAPEHRSELFKPYFTTHAEGTGLGLAVVEQIVLAHGWEIACLPNQPSGAIFRITHIKAAGKA